MSGWEEGTAWLKSALLESKTKAVSSGIFRESSKAFAALEPCSLPAAAFCRYANWVLKRFIKKEVWAKRLEPLLGKPSFGSPEELESGDSATSWSDRSGFDLENARKQLRDACFLFQYAVDLMELVVSKLQPSMRDFWCGAFRLDGKTFIATRTSHAAMRCLIQKIFSWVLQLSDSASIGETQTEASPKHPELATGADEETNPHYSVDLNRDVRTALAQFDEDMLVLGLFDLWRDLVSVQVYEAIEEQASKLAHGELCRSVSSIMLTWVNRLIRPWLRAMQPDDVDQQPSSSSRPWYDDASSWEKRVLYFTHEALLHARLEELFDIIVEFPASKPALVDIRECLEHTDALEEMTQSLCSQLERRLLHPGASTSDILHHSVNTIQSLLLIEPHGFLLSRASKRIHRYLSSNRPEAMACLVELFTSPEGMSLFPTDSEQLVSFAKAMKRPSSREMHGDMRDATEDLSDSDWEPDPIDAPLTGSASERRGQMARNFARLDVLSILMNLCGGRRRFIAEFHRFLAERLTSVMDYDFESLLRNLEILKVRLGPASLSDAETILKDVSDSRRFSNFVRSQSETLSKSDTQIELLTISYLYWPCIFPENRTEERHGSHRALLTGPGLIGSDYFALLERHRYRLVSFLEHFLRTSEECFARQKAPRVLRWIPALGICDLDLDFADGRHVHMQNVPLVNAMLIELFAHQPRFTLNELVEKMFDTKRGDDSDSVDEDCQRLRSSMIERALQFWLRHSILRPVGSDLYEVIEYAEGYEQSSPESLDIDATQPDPIADALSAAPFTKERIENSDQDSEQRIFENYIIGMLANFESLSLERIHQMLSMFCKDPPFRGTFADVAACLSRLLDAGRIRFEHGQYHRKA